MRSKKYRVFHDEVGNEYQFSHVKFTDEIKNYKQRKEVFGESVKLKDVYNHLSDCLCVSVEAIKNWKMGYNGPADLTVVKNMADYLEIPYTKLLDNSRGDDYMCEIKEKVINMNIATDEKEALRSIIRDLLELINQFYPSLMYTRVIDEHQQVIEDGVIDYYSIWLNKIKIKIDQSRLVISQDAYQRLERLFLETCAFTDSTWHCQTRWISITPVFELFYKVDLDDDIDWSDISLRGKDEYGISEKVQDRLVSDYKHYEWNVEVCDALYMIGLKIGSWYLDIVEHDFPELFV